MESDHRGGIFALVDILIAHWGAVERDLVAAGLHWSDLGTGRLSLGELVSFVLWAPPGTATYFARAEKFTPESHLLSMAVDELRVQTWLNTEDAQRDPADQKYRPTPLPRPGVTYIDPDAQQDKFTVEDYMARVGLTMIGGGDGGQEAVDR